MMSEANRIQISSAVHMNSERAQTYRQTNKNCKHLFLGSVTFIKSLYNSFSYVQTATPYDFILLYLLKEKNDGYEFQRYIFCDG